MNNAIQPQRAAARKPMKKNLRVLRALLEGAHTSRELEQAPVFDHCAHSTTAELRKRNVDIHTEMVEVVGYAGIPTRIARYSLTEAGRRRAVELLGDQA